MADNARFPTPHVSGPRIMSIKNRYPRTKEKVTALGVRGSFVTRIIGPRMAPQHIREAIPERRIRPGFEEGVFFWICYP